MIAKLVRMLPPLSSGGIIANYRCPAACGHCLYGCSPKAEPGYMREDTAAEICARLRRLGCPGVHIGGGEPFLYPQKLAKLIAVILESGLRLEYIETNAAWVSGDDIRDRGILAEIRRAGGDCIMVSADPFHVEFIPFAKPLRLIRLLQEEGFSYFVWQERYVRTLRGLDPNRTYDRQALREVFGYDLIGRAAREYGMRFGGRALNLLREGSKKRAANTFTAPCPELCDTNHFHVDFLGRYIPPGCTGMGILLADLGEELDPQRYPVLCALLQGGVRGLLEYALDCSFSPDPQGYVSKCELCFCIRKYLIHTQAQAHPDLTPDSFYRQNY